jgi:ABC-type antimicrobial peptide transport system permease subunit
MLKIYFKIAWRNLIKNKVYSAINILGLAAGMAVAMLIALWIWDEVTFNNYHTNHKQLAQVMSTSFNDKNEGATGKAVVLPLGNELRNRYGGDFKRVSMASWNGDHMLSIGESTTKGRGIFVEQDFPSMFSFKMLKGDINALNDPSSVLLSASMTKALFGDTDPINKTVKLDNKDDLKVAGVYEDIPRNSTWYNLKLLLPWTNFIAAPWVKSSESSWYNHSFQAFVQVNENGDIDRISDKIKKVAVQHKNVATEGKEDLFLHPMNKWYLYNDFKNGKISGGRIQFVWLFGIIGIFVLLLACINFMNLSTARSEKRAKEVGVRKTVGSLKAQLIAQFLSESVLIAFLSFFFSVLLVILLMPLFNKLAAKSMTLPWDNVTFWLLAILFTLVTGLISGCYPAFYLSGFKPIKVLKGTFRVGRFATLPRKVLVVVQFTFSIALIIGTIIVFKQIQYTKNRPVNYRNEGLITTNMSTPDLYGHYDALRNDLLATGVVSNMAESNSSTTSVSSNNIGFKWSGKDPNSLPTFGTIYVTEDFGQTIGWQIIEGRDFSKDFATDSLAIILNESAVNDIGLDKDIVGETIQYKQRNYTVIGVIKDMIMESPYKPVRATIFFNNLKNCNTITICIKQGIPVQAALSKIATVYKKYDAPFDYTFNDEDYAKKFSSEQRVAKLATFFTILAIFISCLGLFGLASFVAEQRKKEIGLRKVLGASVFNLWRLLSKEFALLVIISLLISIPLAWYFMHNWLQNYQYRAELSWWIFAAAGSGALMITIMTVSFQAIKAAMANPVRSLRSE